MAALTLTRPTASLEAGGFVKGAALGTVKDNKDPEGLGRVRVRFLWHERDQLSEWARVAVMMAGSEQGSYFLPEKEQEVVVVFEREDVNFPIVVGALWSGQRRPPENNKDGKNDRRVIRSRKGHQILFDDGSKGLVELKLNDGKKLALDDDGIRLDDGQGNKLAIDSKSGAMKIEVKGQLSIKAKTIAIESSGTMNLKSTGAMTVRGNVVQIN